MIRNSELWQAIIQTQNLSPLEQDILVCVIAPQVNPRLGWLYQELQPGIASHYPSQALLQELLFIEGREYTEFFQTFTPRAALFRNALITRRTREIFEPLAPTAKALELMLGFNPSAGASPPGTTEVPTEDAWECLILPDSCLQLLREYLYWITQREKVAGAWGSQVTGGPVALFCGPSGTGKTYAARVLANTLGYPLFRADLGLIVSKYIGETEQNLNALFDAATGRELLLLFDEADSLFGRRGEVKDARDRYANMEVSHLLARIEQYRGPCILTTNLRHNLDTAFARRFQMVIEFPRADPAARQKLWERYLPPHAPYAPEVDVALLAAELNLTGAQIRNVALHAAFLAAGDSDRIGLEHLAKAVWVELAKEGREIAPSSLGKLSSYLQL